MGAVVGAIRVTRGALLLAAALLACAPGTASADWTGLAANNQYPFDSISTFDASSGAFGQTLGTDGDNVAVEPSADGTTAYAVVLYPGDYLDAIDLGTGARKSLPTGHEYIWEAVSPNGGLIYLSGSESIQPVELSGSEMTLGKRIEVPGAAGVAFAPDGRTAWVADGSGVVPVDVASGTVGEPIATGAESIGVAVSPDGSTVWVANRAGESVSAVNTATGTVTTIPVPGHPRNVAVAPDGRRVWVALESEHELTWIDTSDHEVGTPVDTGGVVAEDLAITPDGRTVYVTAGAFDGTGRGSEVIPVDISGATPHVEAPIADSQFDDPVWGAITPDQAPVANLAVAAAPPGAATAFDASSSLPGSTPTVSWSWNFGDGTSATTSAPTVSHVYAAAGEYEATVTETDAAGTSTAEVYTGQQALRAGAPTAAATRSVVISSGAEPAVALSATHLDFGSHGVHAPPAAQSVSVTDAGAAPLHIAADSLTGAGAAQFHLAADGCAGATVAPAGSCSLTVQFAPTGGLAVAQLAIADDASGSPHTVLLSGEGSTVGRVRGVVRDGSAGDAPLAGAQVSACTTATRAVCRSATTAAGGEYTVAGLPAGEYAMEVFPPRPGLGAGAATVQIGEGEVAEQDFTLSAPVALSHGVTFTSGSGTAASGAPTVRWDEPFSFQVPLRVPSEGPPGGLKLVTLTGSITLHSGTGGNGGFGAAATENVLVSYDSSGRPAAIVGLEDDSGLGAEAGAGAARAHAAGGAGGLVKAAKEGFDMGKEIAEKVKYSRDKEGNEVLEIKQKLPYGPTMSKTFYKHKAGDEGSFTTFELPTGQGLCEKLPAPVKGAGQKISEELNKLNNEISKRIQELEAKAGKALPEAINSTQQAIKEAEDKQAADPNNLSKKMFAPSLGLLAPFPGSLRAFSAGGAGTIAVPGFEAGESFASAAMTATLLYGGRAYGEGWPQGRLPLPGAGVAVVFSLPSLEQRIHGEIDWHAISSASTVQTSGVAVPADCESPQPESEEFGGSGYVDPSGVVVTRTGVPVAGAKVVLERASARRGKLAAVANGSVVMSPANRRNPDRTNALGHFGWDVLSGFYRVSSSHPGCRPYRAASPVLAVPPPVSDLRLVLSCPHLRRARTSLALRAVRRPERRLTLLARVRGRSPRGYVTFKVGSRTIAQVTLSRRGTAAVTVAAVAPARVVALYSGDGRNAPSRRRG
jgi:YVTN family beta-propeller protein